MLHFYLKLETMQTKFKKVLYFLSHLNAGVFQTFLRTCVKFNRKLIKNLTGMQKKSTF